MFIALHIRAVSLEVCRKRALCDFHRKMAELLGNSELRGFAEVQEKLYGAFSDVYLGCLFALIHGLSDDKIDYWCFPFTRNLEVSCCGMLNVTEDFDSAIGFNLISFEDMSALCLTVFDAAAHYVSQFLSGYSMPEDLGLLVNDIAFRRCEEPLISPRVWKALSKDQKLAVGLSLRPPSNRLVEVDCNIIRVSPEDWMQPHPDHMLRLHRRIYLKSGDILL